MIIYVGWIVLSIAVGFAGRHRALGFWGFFLASLFFSPILMLLVLLVTQPKTQYEPRRRAAAIEHDSGSKARSSKDSVS